MIKETEMRKKIIFLGNGPLADESLLVLERYFDVIFHARDKADLETVKDLKRKNPDAYGVLASFGVMIRQDVLDLFEPEGILNIHPSLLPLYRGSSPIETAILNGDTDFSVSVMKLALGMDAGPVYFQRTLQNLPLNKAEIYRALAQAGAEWIAHNLDHLPEPVAQDDTKATFTEKLDKSMSLLTPEIDSAEKTLRKIVAFDGFPKAKYDFLGIRCIILEAHILQPGKTATLELPCADGIVLSIDYLQPEGRKVMDAKSFLNGYGTKR